MPARRVVIAGEVYSPNLGDGIISETMRYIFTQVDPGLEVIPLDISGRQTSNPDTPISSLTRLKVIDLVRRYAPALYARLNAARLEYHFRRGLGDRWRQTLAGADALVIGGGQLLMDDFLDFPTKLAQLGRLAREIDLPLHISACGVGNDWSPRGKLLIEEVLVQATSTTLRDAISQTRLGRLFPGHISECTADPAIWAAQLYSGPQAMVGKTIGLGLLNPADLKLRNPGQTSPMSELEAFWLGLFSTLRQHGIQFELFGNGSLTDQAFGQRLVAAARSKLGLSIHLAPRPTQPVELAHRVSGYAGVVAFRLHAILLAISFGLPCLGLAWDAKVPALFDVLDLGHYCFDRSQWRPEDVAERIAAQVANPQPYRQLERLKAQAQRNAQIVLQA
jgi:polysaccharide pyruvyl transferase WcaK-like protein